MERKVRMKKTTVLIVLLILGVLVIPLYAKDFTGLFDVSLGNSSHTVENKLAMFGWHRESEFKNINEFKKDGADLYGYPVNCIDLKFNNDKLSMITVYFNIDSELEDKIQVFSDIQGKIVSEYEFVLNNEKGSFSESNYRGTFTNNRKMLVVGNPNVSDSNFMVSITDIDLLLYAPQSDISDDAK